jgi:hypothetical protein
VCKELGALATHPFLTKRAIPQHVPECRHTLVEDFLPMSHEEQPRMGQALAQTAVVHGSHYGFPSASRRGEQIPVSTAQSR